MKRIVSLIIVFLFVFNFVSSLFAMQQETVDINGFDDFSIEQVQKTFANTLSQEQTANNQDNEKQMLFSNEVLYNTQSISFVKKLSSHDNLFFENKSYGLNYLYHYKFFERNVCLCGISEYKINFNSYMATAIIDIYGIVFCI